MLIWVVLFGFGPHPRWTMSRKLGQWPEVCDLPCMSWEEEKQPPSYLRTCSPPRLKGWSFGGEASIYSEDLTLHP